MKLRPQTRSRQVPVTLNGITEMVPEKYTVYEPVPPRDWDHIVLRGVSAITAGVLTVSVLWSTSSIGDLLTMAAAPVVAYTTASIFDAAWITFMAIEWLSRYNPARARLPRWAGHTALLIAMAAVCTHGFLHGGARGIAAGIIGSFVSALAKTVWTVVMRHTSKPLDHLTQGWVNRRMSEAGGRLALATIERQLARTQGQLADTVAALSGPEPDPDKPSGQTDITSADTRSAVLAALTTMPDAQPEDIVELLAQIGITTDTDTVRDLSGQQADTKDSSSKPHLRLASGASPSIAKTVRQALSAGLSEPSHVLQHVRAVHGPDTSEDTVKRTLRRISRPA